MLEKWDDSFAKNQLEKYGWKNGEGLGKNKHGNAKHISVKVKNDTKGVGKNQEQWDFAWWDHLYNKSASSVSVEKDTEANEIRIATKKKSENRKSETGILSTYRPTAQGKSSKKQQPEQEESSSSSMAAMADQANLMDSVKSVHSTMAQTIARSSLYGGFVKSSSTLLPSSETSTPKSTSSSNTNSDEEEDNNNEDSDDDDGKDYSIKMTDAELFAACEGRTARKGGLGLVEQKGKYARVMQDYLAHSNKDDESSNVTATTTIKRKREEQEDGDASCKVEKKKNKSKEKKEKKEKKNKEKKEKKEKSKKKDKEEKKDKKKKSKKEKKA
ncbi:hypothetical protein BDA99DRAFT_497071 [Phascolomyces articulosus]|uniref:G-patch domain-containing protein n=1 Tax=Phascolomyces articulosus TaxID=60185 RepID=A0AAD5KKD8_9FUNG|nr:hypothetical protein BDA99DRAFT_497071 [Phascolomyces articulosus]